MTGATQRWENQLGRDAGGLDEATCRAVMDARLIQRARCVEAGNGHGFPLSALGSEERSDCGQKPDIFNFVERLQNSDFC